MSSNKFEKKYNHPRLIMKYMKLPILLLMILFLYGGDAVGQINDYYAVSIGRFYGAPGDTILMPIYLRNQDDPANADLNGDVGAFLLRIKYDDWLTAGGASMENLLYPIVSWWEIPNPVVDPNPQYYMEGFVTGRGDGLIYTDPGPPMTVDTPLFIYNQPITDSIANYMIVRYIPPFWDMDIGPPFIEPSGTDSTICLYVRFVVNEDAVPGDFTYLYFENEIGTYIENQLSDALGLYFIKPRLRNLTNIFTVSLNDAPEVGNIVPNVFNIQAGQTVPSVTVSATDPDGDYLCLQATNVPSGATFGGAGHETCGTASVSGTFNWTTTAADTGTHVVGFIAEDDQGMASESKFITINVSGGTTTENDPPVVNAISPNNFTVQQGQSIPTVTVSAYDPEGKTLYLEAIGYPPSAQFNPGNPVNGTGTVSMTMNWTTSFMDEGLYTINFQATDNEGAKSAVQSVYVTVTKIEEDRLFTKSTWGAGTRPTGGLPGATPVSFPVDLATTKTVYGVNFDMTYPGDIARLDSITVTDRTPEYIIYDNIGAWNDSVRVITFGLNNEVIIEGSSTAILNMWYTMDSIAAIGDYWIHFYDAWESIDPDPEVLSLELAIDSGIIQIDMLGDVNLDGRINVDDPVKIVSYIIGTFGLPKRNHDAANVVGDTLVNVIDLVGVINLFFGDTVETSPAPINYDGEVAKLAIEHDDLMAGQYTKLNVRGEFPEDVAGIQLQIDYDPEALTFERPEIPQKYNRYRLDYTDDGQGRIRLVLSTFQSKISGDWITTGINNFLNLPANIKKDIEAGDDTKVRITEAFLSNPAAREIPLERPQQLLPTTFVLGQNYPNPFNADTRIAFEIAGDNQTMQHVKLKIYNILGQKVKTLVDQELGAGKHIVSWDATDDNGSKVATGVYLYRLNVDDRSESRKMMLLK